MNKKELDTELDMLIRWNLDIESADDYDTWEEERKDLFRLFTAMNLLEAVMKCYKKIINDEKK